MPTQSDILGELREQAGEDTLPYISKSRLSTYQTCPRKFYFKYIQGMRPPENEAMKRGTRIHETFEQYYENLIERETIPDELRTLLPDDTSLWADFVDPYISNFLLWEQRRLNTAPSRMDFLPVGIEAEGWDKTMDPMWMGYADVITPASSHNEIDSDDGVVIVDFKTGKTPKESYRDTGIFLEGEYYSMLFEEQFQVSAVAGYYPKNDDFIFSELDSERREEITKLVNKMNSDPDRENFPTDPQPLCKWGESDDEQCDFYDICESEWGEKGGPGPTY